MKFSNKIPTAEEIQEAHSQMLEHFRLSEKFFRSMVVFGIASFLNLLAIIIFCSLGLDIPLITCTLGNFYFLIQFTRYKIAMDREGRNFLNTLSKSLDINTL